MTESTKLTHIQHELYILVNKKIDLENIQSALLNKCEYLNEFIEIIKVLEDKNTLGSYTEYELTKSLIQTVNSILEKQLQEIDQKFLEVSKELK